MARRDFLLGYMHAMRKVAGMSFEEFNRKMLADKDATVSHISREMEEASRDIPGTIRREHKALNVLTDVKSPKLSGGGGGLGAAAIAGLIGIPLATGGGLYLLHRSRNK